MSRLLPGDLTELQSASNSDKRDHTGCLITEVVFPGFAWEDHGFLTRKELEGLWAGADGNVKQAEEWLAYVKA